MPSILNLPSLTTSTGNIVFPVVDVNVTPNTTKKATLSQIKDYIGATVIAPQGYNGSEGRQGYSGSAGSGYIGSQGQAGYVGSTGIGYVGSVGFGYTGSASTELGYNGSTGYTGSIGAPIFIAGSTSTFSTLPIAYEGFPGNVYITLDDGYGNVWDGLEWTSLNQPIQGPTGYTGSLGNIGYIGSIGYVGSASNTIGYTGSTGFFTGSTSDAIITTNTSGSTSTTTGALQVSGGVGIGGNLNAGGSVRANAFFALPSYIQDDLGLIVAPPEGSIIYVSDAPGGGRVCFYDGSNWYTIDDNILLA